MLKKYYAIALLSSAALLPVSITASAQESSVNVEILGDNASDEPTEISGDWVPSEEINTVEESPVAQKMTQEEKSKNAAENDSWGGAITIIAMGIVISALVILSILFACFGKVSEALLTKKKKEAKGAANHVSDDTHDDLDSGEVIAAIAAALSEHFGSDHDIEDTILTIRRMKKAYSPWSSKLYGLRHYPDSPIAHPGGNALRQFNAGKSK